MRRLFQRPDLLQRFDLRRLLRRFDPRRFLQRFDLRRLLRRFDPRRFLRWYGAGPLHLLTMLGCFALAGYATAELLPNNAVGIPIWFVGAVIGHDLILMPMYTVADRSVMAVFRHRRPQLPAVPWINYLRVPAALSGMLLLIWFPLIFRLPRRFTATTTLSLDPFLWHWLAVTGALFLLSAMALAVRLRGGRGRRKTRDGRRRWLRVRPTSRLRTLLASKEHPLLRTQQAGEELLDRLPPLGDRDP
jgi:hypothetical protein